MSRPRRRRVATAHHVAGAAFRLALLYALAGGIWAVVRVVQGGFLWGPLHTFLVGSVLLAISGGTQLFVITWAAARPPPAWLSDSQRRTLAAGALLLVVGREGGMSAVAVVGAVGVVLSLVLLAASLVLIVRSSLLRRFDWPARFYLLAAGAGLAGTALGLAMVAGAVGLAVGRQAHFHLTLVGLVGLTILGTLPTLLPTFAHHPMVSGRELALAWWAGLGAVVAYGAAVTTPMLLTVGNLLVLVAAVSVLGGITRLGWTRMRRGGLPFAMVVTGVVWLAAWLMVDILVMVGAVGAQIGSRWLGVAVLGVAQVLLGAFTYLLPVVIGPRSGHGPSFDRMLARPWLPYGTSTAGAAALALGLSGGMVVPLVILWAFDFFQRVVGLLLARRARPLPR